MRKLLILALLIFVGSAGWRIGDMLSQDALSMAIGMLFGVMAGIPTALLVMASNRRSRDDETDARTARQLGPPMPYLPQPPVVVLSNGGAYPPQQAAMAQGAAYGHQNPDEWAWAQSARHFKLVGEQEAWIEE